FTCTTPRECLCGSAFSWSNGCASTCRGDDRLRGLDFAGGRRLNSTKSLVCMPFHNMPPIGALACLEVKMIGKPYAGELQVRFDEGEQDFVSYPQCRRLVSRSLRWSPSRHRAALQKTTIGGQGYLERGHARWCSTS